MHYLATLSLLGIFFHNGMMESSFTKLGLSSTELGYAMMFSILLSPVNFPPYAEAPAEAVQPLDLG